MSKPRKHPSQSPDAEAEYLSAQEAQRLLGVRAQTLYAYVSRGLVRSLPAARGRARSYAAEDVRRLKTRSDARRGHAAVAASALRWGEPVLDSGITLIRGDDLFYRGHSVCGLVAANAPFERAIELLWQRPWAFDASDATPSKQAVRGLAVPARGDAVDAPRFGLLLGYLTALRMERGPLEGTVSEQARREGARLVYGLLHASCLSCGRRSSAEPSARSLRFAERLARGLQLSADHAPEALDAALILCADHELNVSAFATRVTASGGADLYACVLAGLAALSGRHHGGHSDQVEALHESCARPSAALARVQEAVRSRRRLPGFGHPLYPSGDPRARLLLELSVRLSGKRGNARLAVLRTIAEAAREHAGALPNLDFGLVALRVALGLPRGAGALLFALGRTAGLVAHAIEQEQQGFLLRPRARYVGPPALEAPPSGAGFSD